jgi:hypothetical protein
MVTQGGEEDVEAGLAGEEGEPWDRRAGDEVGDAWFSDGVAGSHGAWGLEGGEAGASPENGVPKQSLGTRLEIIFEAKIMVTYNDNKVPDTLLNGVNEMYNKSMNCILKCRELRP